MDYRFPARVREFIAAAGDRLENRRVLAPWEVAVALGVTKPQVRLLISRDCYSQWSFAVSGRCEQFETRRLAQAMVSGVASSPEAEAALGLLAEQGADALVAGSAADARRIAELLAESGGWRLAGEAGTYRLFLRSNEDSSQSCERTAALATIATGEAAWRPKTAAGGQPAGKGSRETCRSAALGDSSRGSIAQ